MPPDEVNATAGADPADATKTPGSVGQDEVVDPKTEGSEGDAEPDAGAEEGGAGDEGGDADAGDGTKKQLSAEEKAKFGLTRRIGRLTNERARLLAENEQLRKQVMAQPKAEGEEDAPPQLTEQDVERRAQALAAQRLEQQRIAAVVDSTIKAGQKAYKDFDALTQAVDDAIDGFADEQGRMRPLTAAIFDAEKPHDLIKFLAENPEDAADLAALPPIRQVRRIAQIEIELGKASQPKASSAPKPITPARGSGAVQKDPSKMTDKEWYEQERKRGG
jgi:hypothetical protein